MPDYGEKVPEVGNRVEIHPGFDLWMQGARTGVVVKVGALISVRMDHKQVKKLFKAKAEDLKVISAGRRP
jgi:hypothetical protein